MDWRVRALSAVPRPQRNGRDDRVPRQRLLSPQHERDRARSGWTGHAGHRGVSGVSVAGGYRLAVIRPECAAPEMGGVHGRHRGRFARVCGFVRQMPRRRGRRDGGRPTAVGPRVLQHRRGHVPRAHRCRIHQSQHAVRCAWHAQRQPGVQRRRVRQRAPPARLSGEGAGLEQPAIHEMQTRTTDALEGTGRDNTGISQGGNLWEGRPIQTGVSSTPGMP